MCSALIQCHFDYSCSSWFPGINMTLTKKLQIIQNKMIRFILNLKSRDSIRNKELSKSGFLNVTDRVKQLMMNHVFKIRNYKCPPYMLSRFSRLNEDLTGMTTRASETDFLTYSFRTRYRDSRFLLLKSRMLFNFQKNGRGTLIGR